MTRKRLKILFTGNSEALTRYMENLEEEGMDVIPAPFELSNVVEILRDRPVDMVIMESNGAKSKEIIGDLKRVFQRERPPFLFILETGTAPEFIDLMDPALDDYLIKPVSEQPFKWKVKTLADRIRAQMQGTATLSGSLEKQGIADIVQFLELAGHSGWLIVETHGIEGRLGVNKGKVISAEFGNLSGPDAFYALAAANRGTFHFRFQSNIPDSGNITMGNYALIIEAMKRIDETGREELLGRAGQKEAQDANVSHGDTSAELTEEKPAALEDFFADETSESDDKTEGGFDALVEWLNENS